MEIPIYIVDAFTHKRFHGNPAAVCLLEKWLDEGLLKSIAAENNLSETAFLVGCGGGYALRWFTPTVEVALCGHATLAAAHALFTHRKVDTPEIGFETRSGRLSVKKEGRRLVMDFPAHVPVPDGISGELAACLGARPVEVWRSEQVRMAVFEDESEIASLSPDFNLMAGLDDMAVMVTAKGNDVDFVSRFFAPKLGIPEDPVTGSAHCTLIPYWAEKLNMTEFHARQVSSRGGDLYCVMKADRVLIGGEAVTYSRGVISLWS